MLVPREHFSSEAWNLLHLTKHMHKYAINLLHSAYEVYKGIGDWYKNLKKIFILIPVTTIYTIKYINQHI